MIALTSPLLWYTARASGIVSLLLLTAVMALGVMTATRVGGRPMPRFAVAEVHRRIALMTMIFLVLHILTTVLDTYVHIGLLAALIPFTSPYKTVWVAFGSVAFDLLLAVTIASLLKQRISHAAWRAIHWLSYVSFPIAIIHVLMIGTDTRFPWMLLLVAGCVGTLFLAIAWRLWAHPRPDGALTAVPRRKGRPGTTAAASTQHAPRGRKIASSGQTRKPR